LTIVRSDLRVGNFSAASVASFGELPSLSVKNLRARDFSMTRAAFAGPGKWEIKSGANFTNITLNVGKISISSFLDTSRGQDVYVSEFGEADGYSSGSGIRANVVKTDNIILRDQTSAGLISGAAGAALIEIRPGGTTLVPDVLLSGVNNDALQIPISAADGGGKFESCRAIILRHGGKYNSESLANSIVCQFVMYNRIERRIDIKRCLINGGVNCDL